MAIDIVLEDFEMQHAAFAGVIRHLENMRAKRQSMYGEEADTNDWQRWIEGAAGEIAVAKYLNAYWPGSGKVGAPDVGERHDVRTTQNHNYKLILHDEDADERIFWLVTGSNGRYKIHGWIKGHEGKQQKFWTEQTGRPAYFIPQGDLHKIDPNLVIAKTSYDRS
jgi:hypothetical protein